MQSTSNLIQVLPRIASRVYQPQDWFAAQALFPLFRAPHATGGYYIIGDSDFISNPPSLIRSPGAPFARHQMILKDDTYACELFGLEESIGQEENAKYASPGAPTQIAKRRLLSTMLLVGELRAQTVATGASVPSANPGVLWSNPASDPLSDVSVVRSAITDYCAQSADAMAVAFTPQTDGRKSTRRTAPALPESPLEGELNEPLRMPNTAPGASRKTNLTGLAPVRSSTSNRRHISKLDGEAVEA